MDDHLYMSNNTRDLEDQVFQKKIKLLHTHEIHHDETLSPTLPKDHEGIVNLDDQTDTRRVGCLHDDVPRSEQGC